VDPDIPASQQHGSGRKRLTGTLIVVYALLDPVVGVTVTALAIWVVNPVIMFAVTAIVLLPLNVACCTWIMREWDGWIAGRGARIETRLQRMRSSRVMRHPVEWITDGSDGSFGLAAALTNAITAVSIGRMLGGQPITARRIRIASLTFAVFFAAVYSVLGWIGRQL